jgi:serine/threonine-protein kinase
MPREHSSEETGQPPYVPANGTLVDSALARQQADRSAAGEGSVVGPDTLAAAHWHYAIVQTEQPYAEGAMGTILLAHDQALRRTVVLKVLHKRHQNDEGLCHRFRREATITAQLQHPGIPPVFAVGSMSDARPFFSMTLVQGRTLAQLLAESKGRPSDRPRFLTIFQQVCQTIAFAHARGVIHCDLKPENIVVGEYGVVYVMDWGIARLKHDPGSTAGGPTVFSAAPLATAETVVLQRGMEPEGEESDSAKTVPGSLQGTPQYMSPEQARGECDQDERTDVFSLGAILFEILVGEPLRPSEVVPRRSLARFADLHLGTAAARLDASKGDPPIVDLVKRCLQRDRKLRPADGSVVASLVEAYTLHVLERPERDLARFFELSLDLFCLAGLDGFFKQVNRNFSRVLGFSSEELLSTPFLEFVHPDDREQTQLQVAKLSQGIPVVRFENRYRDRVGGYKWFEWAAKSIPEEGIIFATAREITRRKHLEQRFHSSVESSPAATVVSDRNGCIVLINRAAEHDFGYSRAELIGQPVEILVPERLRADHRELRSGYLANPAPRPCTGREFRGLSKDGTEIPIELGLNPFVTEEGVFIISTMIDLRSRRGDEAQYQALVESFPTGILLIDQSGIIRLVNREAERLFGYHRSDLIGLSAQHLVPGLVDRSRERPGSVDDLTARRKNGSSFPVVCRVSRFDRGAGTFLLAAVMERSR